MLTSAMADAGARNGFTDVTAEFSAFRDFKLKWTRTSNWISLEVSDYLRDAPRSVIESLTETVFARFGGEDGKEYSEEVCEYLNSQGFLRDNQDIFLRRFGESPRQYAGRTWTSQRSTGGSWIRDSLSTIRGS